MKSAIYLLTYGNHAKDLEAIAWRTGFQSLVICDDDDNVNAEMMPDKIKGSILIGVNDPTLRRQIADRYEGVRGCPAFIDPSAVIGPDCKVGRGSVVAPLASLLRSVTLGNHVHVNYQVGMTRCSVGDFSTVSPGAIICGNVTIGEECYVGANATVCEKVTIGNRVIIGAGSIVPPFSVVPDDAKIIGVFRPDVPL